MYFNAHIKTVWPRPTDFYCPLVVRLHWVWKKLKFIFPCAEKVHAMEKEDELQSAYEVKVSIL